MRMFICVVVAMLSLIPTSVNSTTTNNQQIELRFKVSRVVRSCNPIDLTIPLIKKHEGLRLTAYPDNGRYSIGYGTVSKCGETITEREAIQRMKVHLYECADSLDRNVSWWRELPISKQVALLDMTFNLGTTGVNKFKRFLSALKFGDWDKAAKEIMYRNSDHDKLVRTPYARQTGKRCLAISGLISGSVDLVNV